MKPVLAVSGSGSALARLRRDVLYLAEFLTSTDGVITARLFAGIHDDTKLRRRFLERYAMPRRKMQRRFIREAIAVGQFKRGNKPGTADRPTVLWVVAGARSVRQSFAERILEKVIPAFEPQ
jgi:hypothetical protein